MANPTNTLMHSFRIIFISTGLLFIAAFFTPRLFTCATANLPALWTSFRSCLRPPFLYFVINAIILTIAASSRLRRQPKDPAADHHHHSVAAAVDSYTYTAPIAVQSPPLLYDPYDAVLGSTNVVEKETAPSVAVEDKEKEKAGAVIKDDDRTAKHVGNDGIAPAYDVGSTVTKRKKTKPKVATSAPLTRQGTLEIVTSFFESQIEKNPSTAVQLGYQRKPAKAALQGVRSLQKPKRNDTLENTWKAITEGQRTKQLKKSDTCKNPQTSSDPAQSSVMFRDRSNYNDSPASPSQDELNRRVEAFISKFNEDMRLQRQESVQQFMDMINPAAY